MMKCIDIFIENQHDYATSQFCQLQCFECYKLQIEQQISAMFPMSRCPLKQDDALFNLPLAVAEDNSDVYLWL